MTRLRLLREVSYDGRALPGSRPAALLAALAAERSGVRAERLVDLVWPDDPPANPAKAVQVLVSRVRAVLGADAITHRDGAYRLALPVGDVDAWALEAACEEARSADPTAALAALDRALALVDGLVDGDGVLGDLRREAALLARQADRQRGLLLARVGREADAVQPLAAAHERDRGDEEVLAALLRAEAAVTGVPAALERYDAHRRDLRDRLGLDPSTQLQRLHRELLAADAPVRTGLQFDADELLGRDDDLARLRALVASGRLTTILGPGGLGKTRIAHVLAREAREPRVHFVELVGVTAAEDVVGAVGSALGVRNSVTGRRALTPAQVADVRGRIAQELGTAPTLLVLDNCEHLLDAVASLVAFLLVATRDLRVVTTSRAPLSIAAERVLALSQLAPEDGVRLFCRRARAVRPEADLPEDVVAAVVARLDGLPLAVELAAARVRTMSVAQVLAALDDRFEVLRARDRALPARHQTLSAVIAWSWDLLRPEEQGALAWLSVFHDGFSAEAAAGLLGRDSRTLVDGLVDQSLLTVADDGDGVRYRMLETVREFSRQRLDERGETEAALAAQGRWAVAVARDLGPMLSGADQVQAIARLRTEDTNLGDVLRRLLVAGDAASAVPLLATLGMLWSITGDHPRMFAIAGLAEQVLMGHVPEPEDREVTSEAMTLLLMHIGFLRAGSTGELRDQLLALGPPVRAWARAIYAVMVEADEDADRLQAALDLAARSDDETAVVGLQWAAVLAENEGRHEDAHHHVEQALARVSASTTEHQVATLHTQLAQLSLQRGDHAAAARHARTAEPMLRRIQANDDAIAMRMTVAICALAEGDPVRARALLPEEEPAVETGFGSVAVLAGRAELALAEGDPDAGLTAYDKAVHAMSGTGFAGQATGLEPWVLVTAGAALVAHVRHARTAAQVRRRDELAEHVHAVLARLFDGEDQFVDYPVAGMGLAGLAAHALGPGDAASTGVRLLALARACGYNLSFPVMAWQPLVDAAEERAPGRLALALREYGDRRGPELRSEAAAVLAEYAVTSSG